MVGRGDWQPVSERGSLSALIVSRIEKLMAEERLSPGDRLPPEREMALMLEVSRPSLREAVRVLEARDRLVVRHGQGVFVQQPRSERALRQALDSADTNSVELFAMREVLEVPAAGWAAERITAAALQALRATLDEMGALIDGPDPIDFARLADLDVEFHMAIARSAGNRFLHQTSGVLHNIISSGMETTLTIPGRVQLSRRDHEKIYAALQVHDPTTARRAARAHIRAAGAAAVRRSPAE